MNITIENFGQWFGTCCPLHNTSWFQMKVRILLGMCLVTTQFHRFNLASTSNQRGDLTEESVADFFLNRDTITN